MLACPYSSHVYMHHHIIPIITIYMQSPLCVHVYAMHTKNSPADYKNPILQTVLFSNMQAINCVCVVYMGLCVVYTTYNTHHYIERIERTHMYAYILYI